MRANWRRYQDMAERLEQRVEAHAQMSEEARLLFMPPMGAFRGRSITVDAWCGAPDRFLAKHAKGERRCLI